MIFSSFILIVFAVSGSAGIKIMTHDVGQLVDDLIEFIVPVMEANGDTEINFMKIHGNASIPAKKIKEFLKSASDPTVMKYLRAPSDPVIVTYKCAVGRFGNLTTIQRKGPAIEILHETVKKNHIIEIMTFLTLQNMYARYPSCKITVNEENIFDAKVIFNVPSNEFSTQLRVEGEGKKCSVSCDAFFVNKFGTITTKVYVAGREEFLLEYLFDQAIKEDPMYVRYMANKGLNDAIRNALKVQDACPFLRHGHAKDDK